MGRLNTMTVDIDLLEATDAMKTILKSADAAEMLVALDLAASEAELDLIDGAIAGTVVASKAVIYDSAGKVRMASASPAAAGASVSDATAMTAMFNTVTG